MIVKSDADWNIVFLRLKDESKVPLLCDGVRVLLNVGAKWKKMKLTIMPIVEGVYLPDHLKPLWGHEVYEANIETFVHRFYSKKIVYALSAAKRKALKKMLSKKVYESGQYQYYYDAFDSFPALKKHYSTHFCRVELLESVCDALFERKKQLPGGIGNVLPAGMKALPAGIEMPTEYTENTDGDKI